MIQEDYISFETAKLLKALVLKWLRIKHNISIEVGWWQKWLVQINKIGDLKWQFDLPEEFDIYEEAIESAILYTLKNLVK